MNIYNYFFKIFVGLSVAGPVQAAPAKQGGRLLKAGFHAPERSF
jgi:hypothetical protein